MVGLCREVEGQLLGEGIVPAMEFRMGAHRSGQIKWHPSCLMDWKRGHLKATIKRPEEVCVTVIPCSLFLTAQVQRLQKIVTGLRELASDVMGLFIIRLTHRGKTLCKAETWMIFPRPK